MCPSTDCFLAQYQVFAVVGVWIHSLIFNCWVEAHYITILKFIVLCVSFPSAFFQFSLFSSIIHIPYVTYHFVFVHLIFKNVFIYLFIWLYRVSVAALWIFSCSTWMVSCVMPDLVPWPGIEPRPPALGAWSLSLLDHQGKSPYHSKKSV